MMARVVSGGGAKGGVFARLIPAEAASDQVDGVVEAARTQVAAVRLQPGFRGFYLLVDREGGKVATVSLWQTRQDAQAVEAQAAKMRADVGSAVGIAGGLAVELYEVAVESGPATG
jgi:heme-degrading monooxygenase HmoA